MRKLILTLGLILTFTAANAEIVIEKLEDPPYLNPDGTTYRAENDDIQGNTPSSSVSNSISKISKTLNSAQLSKIERKIYARDYTGDTTQNRLIRLERQVFGAAQRGDETIRIKRLAAATQSYTNNYAWQNPTVQRYNDMKYNTKRNRILRRNNIVQNYNDPYNMYSAYRPYQRTGLKEFFKVFTGGSLTGFSPNPSPYTSSFNQYYTDPNYVNPGNSSNYTDLFSNGTSGSETYYDDGRYSINKNSSGGGCGVKIIY